MSNPFGRRAHALFVALALSACTASPAAEPSPRDAGARPVPDAGMPVPADASLDAGRNEDASSSSSPDASTDDAAVAPAWPEACADVYAPDLLPTFELTFAPEELAGLEADCRANVQQYRPVTFVYGSETYAAMARLKGNWTWDCNKMQFVISFNEVDSDGRFHGLRKLVLDAPWYDRTLLHERAAFAFFRDVGLPSSCANSARVLLNGAYYGLYANVERVDKEYLQRNFELADGNLYQGGVELKTNEDVGDTSDLEALRAASTVEDIAALVDLDQALTEWAAEAMLPALDNYWAGVEINYYLYHHPARGFLYLPYDMDIVFGDGAYTDGSLLWPDAANSDPLSYEHPQWKKEDLMKTVLADGTWCARYLEKLAAARTQYDPERMGARVDVWAAQIMQALADDPHKPFSLADHQLAVAAMKAFFSERASVVDAWLAQEGHCPASF